MRNQELWNQRVRVFNHTFVLLNFRSTIVDYHHKFVCCLVIISRFLVIIPMLYHFAVGSPKLLLVLVQTPTLIRFCVMIVCHKIVWSLDVLGKMSLVQPQCCCFTNLLGQTLTRIWWDYPGSGFIQVDWNSFHFPALQMVWWSPNRPPFFQRGGLLFSTSNSLCEVFLQFFYYNRFQHFPTISL